MAQQVQCPPIAVPLITAAALQTAASVGSAGASFAGAIVVANASGADKLSYRNLRQDFTAPEGVPQEEFDHCYNDLSQESVTVDVQGPVNNNGKHGQKWNTENRLTKSTGVQVDGLPASCMNLATVIDGDADGGRVPTPCGSACLLYDNLIGEAYEKMRNTFDDIKNA